MHAETPRKVHVRRVIEVLALRGDGTEADVAREVYQYWSLDGRLLAERDAVQMEKLTTFSFEFPGTSAMKPILKEEP